MSLKTPVLFIIFNRPNESLKVFNQIKKVKPENIYIAADGPREFNREDIEKCLKTRNLILNEIDWDCNVHKRFLDKNLGCGKAVSSAIDWFFSEVEEGIILEDDCLPNEDFFLFASHLLEYYRFEERIMHISGDNLLNSQFNFPSSYYFSNYSHIWGWATWRRAWKGYKYKNLPRASFLSTLQLRFKKKRERDFWEKIFDEVDNNRIDTWDYQWLFAIWINGGLCVNPQVNLVKNIGFGQNAMHTKTEFDNYSKIQIVKMAELKYPPKIKLESRADKYVFDNYFLPKKKNIYNKLLSLLK